MIIAQFGARSDERAPFVCFTILFLFAEDIEDLKKRLDEIWEHTKSMMIAFSKIR